MNFNLFRKGRQRDDRERNQLRACDDMFHTVLICLERLESLLEKERTNTEESSLQITAMKTSRDYHNDELGNRTRKSYYSELQLQCSTLVISMSETKELNEDTWKEAVTYFLTDLLEWFGGRSESIPYNHVESFALPILAALTCKVEDAIGVSETIKKYVTEIPNSLPLLSSEDKKNAILDGIKEYIIASEKVQQQIKESQNSVDFELTHHIRGNVVDGYKRLIAAMMRMYDTPAPAKYVFKTVQNYLPNLSEACSFVSDEIIDQCYQERQSE